MLLKLDENLGRTHVELLQNAGYEADRVHEQGLSGWTDSAIWKRVCDEGRFFITLDLDFADIRSRIAARNSHKADAGAGARRFGGIGIPHA